VTRYLPACLPRLRYRAGGCSGSDYCLGSATVSTTCRWVISGFPFTCRYLPAVTALGTLTFCLRSLARNTCLPQITTLNIPPCLHRCHRAACVCHLRDTADYRLPCMGTCRLLDACRWSALPPYTCCLEWNYRSTVTTTGASPVPPFSAAITCWSAIAISTACRSTSGWVGGGRFCGADHRLHLGAVTVLGACLRFRSTTTTYWYRYYLGLNSGLPGLQYRCHLLPGYLGHLFGIPTVGGDATT